jgi:hypothetical protein
MGGERNVYKVLMEKSEGKTKAWMGELDQNGS